MVIIFKFDITQVYSKNDEDNDHFDIIILILGLNILENKF